MYLVRKWFKLGSEWIAKIQYM